MVTTGSTHLRKLDNGTLLAWRAEL
jgi:hypothetical protein